MKNFVKSALLLVFFVGVLHARNVKGRGRNTTPPATTTTTMDKVLSDSSVENNLTVYAHYNHSLNETVPENSSMHNSKMHIIQRAKLQIIRIQILKGLGLTQAPNITVPKYENISISESKFCYRPTCSIPSRSTDEEMWTNTTSNVLNLYFNLTSRRHLGGHVKTAALWLHLKAHNHSCLCDSRIIINVGYLAKPLKKHQKKAKRRVTDVRVVTHQSNSWQSFNIQRAVSEWMNPKKNFGLQIVITDQSENILNAREIITHLDCSDPNLQIKECVYNSMLAPINPVTNYPILFIDNETS